MYVSGFVCIYVSVYACIYVRAYVCMPYVCISNHANTELEWVDFELRVFPLAWMNLTYDMI